MRPKSVKSFASMRSIARVLSACSIWVRMLLMRRSSSAWSREGSTCASCGRRSREPRPVRSARGARRETQRKAPLTIEGELIAKSTGTVSSFTVGERVFQQKIGNGNVVAIDGNKLTIRFDKAGEKRVVDSFVERV